LSIRSHVLHVIAADLVLRAVATVDRLAPLSVNFDSELVNAPLREGLVTTNVSAFACLAAFPAFCVAAPGWASTLTSHYVGVLG
jgi:hypothetical protein